MAVKNNLFVTTKQKPDVSTVGSSPSIASTLEAKDLTFEEFYALQIARKDKDCIINDNQVEVSKQDAIQRAIGKLDDIAAIPIPTLPCIAIQKLSKFIAFTDKYILGPIDSVKAAYTDALNGLKKVQDVVNRLASICDGLDTDIGYLTLQDDSKFLEIIDVAMDLADPALWQKISECGTRLALLPASVLAQATRQLAAASIESMVILVNTVENSKLSELEDRIKETAKLVGRSPSQLAAFDSLIALAGFTKDELIKTLPFGFNPGEDIVLAKDVYDASRDRDTDAYADILLPSIQHMARAMVSFNTAGRRKSTPIEGADDKPMTKYVLSNAKSTSKVLNTKTSGKSTLVFGDTWTDQTGFIHILNDRVSTEEKINIFRNNKQVRSRKLNPIPIPVPSY